MTFTVAATLTHRVTVEVEAESIEHAREKFDDGEWKDDGLSGGELVDWERRGEPQEDKP